MIQHRVFMNANVSVQCKKGIDFGEPLPK